MAVQLLFGILFDAFIRQVKVAYAWLPKSLRFNRSAKKKLVLRKQASEMIKITYSCVQF
jgi:hypothetical protein